MLNLPRHLTTGDSAVVTSPTQDTAPPREPRPQVSVVIATRDREQLLEKCLDAVLGQRYAGRIEVVVVYDRSEPVRGHALTRDDREVRVIVNQRTPGLAGARNTGMQATSGSLIAFCDDDDLWRPEKLERQVSAMTAAGASASVTGIAVHYEGRTVDRIPAVDAITADLLTSSRMTGAHPSSYVVSRETVDAVGWVDETLPGGYGEDYDWLLRIATMDPVLVVREPLVDVLWHRGSYFTSRWDAMVASVEYLLEKYPQLRQDAVGLARLQGQSAFALAAQHKRAAALRTSLQAFRSNPREPRVYLSVLVAAGLLEAPWVMHQLNRRGRGV